MTILAGLTRRLHIPQKLTPKVRSPNKGAGGGVLPWKQVATRAHVPRDTIGAAGVPTATQMMSLSNHKAWDDITALKIVVPNFYWNAGHAEAGPGGSPTVTASIEYPAGTFTQVKFGGSATGNLIDNGMLESDACAVVIPKNAWFGVRLFRSNFAAGTMPICLFRNSGLGDKSAYGTAVTDMTMGGTIVNTGSPQFMPCAIIAQTAVKSSLLIGDSRCAGYGDTQDASGDVGELARSIGPARPYINAGIGSDQARYFVAGSAAANRIALKQYCDDVICEMGVNDLGASQSVASILVNLKTMRAAYSDKPFRQTTITVATSGGNTATNATINPGRVTLNDTIRAGVAEFTGYFETADAVENSRNGGLFASSTYTADDLHMTQVGYLVLKNSGAINPAVLN